MAIPDAEIQNCATAFLSAPFQHPITDAREAVLAAQFNSWALWRADKVRRATEHNPGIPVHGAEAAPDTSIVYVVRRFAGDRFVLAKTQNAIDAARVSDMFSRRIKTSSDFYYRFANYNFSSERAQQDLDNEPLIASLVDRVFKRLEHFFGRPQVFRLLPERKPGSRK